MIAAAPKSRKEIINPFGVSSPVFTAGAVVPGIALVSVVFCVVFCVFPAAVVFLTALVTIADDVGADVSVVVSAAVVSSASVVV